MRSAGFYDLVVLDVMLPSEAMVGRAHQAAPRVRSRIPVLFLTARDHVEDRVRGLELGGDDYLIKPFAFVELLARIRTLLRRGPAARGRAASASATSRSMSSAASQACRSACRFDAAGILAPAATRQSPRRSIQSNPDCLIRLGHELRQRHECRRSCHTPAARED